MRSLLILLLSGVLLSRCSSGVETSECVYRVTVPGVWSNCPVVIDEVPMWAKSAVVRDGEREIPSQFDYALGELVFVADISGVHEFSVTYSSGRSERFYPARVHARMGFRNSDGTVTTVDTVASTDSGMLRKLLHGGPAFESELVAYRICLDDRQTVDAYGKRSMRLELSVTGWFPDEEQLRSGYGHDILRVAGSVGVGTLTGWDAEKRKTIPVGPCRRREARILANGPVRTVVEMRVEGWRYCGREIDMTSRYILYAGHGEIQIENIFDGDFGGLVFAAGVARISESEVVRDDELIASLGRDFPEDDSLSGEGERIGLVVAVPPAQVVSKIDDTGSCLFQLIPDERGHIDYVAELLWRQSSWIEDRSDAECMLAMLAAARQAKCRVIVARIR